MKVGIIHYKIASTDGVSLEIEKRIKILEELGHEVVVIGGKFDREIPQKKYELQCLNIDDDYNRNLINQSIKNDNIDENAFTEFFNIQKSLAEKSFIDIFCKEKFDLIIVHNVFSLPLLIWTAVALKNVIEELNIRMICVHHDFYFERDYFSLSSNKILPQILVNMMPDSDLIKHEVINTIAAKKLYKYHKLSSTVLGDYFDFNNGKTGIDKYNSDLLDHYNISANDIVILQATRIVPRKAIEMSILFASHINSKITNYIGKKINGKTITSDSKVVLMFSNYPHQVDSIDYYKDLIKYAKKLKVKIVSAYEDISSIRNIDKNGKKYYSFWDPYYFADFVTYPSIIEGFGNQFLEAVYFNKLIALFEYDVFREDIKKDGYFYVYLDDTYLKRGKFVNFNDEKLFAASDHILRILTNPNLLSELVKYNFESAKNKHDISILKTYIQREYF